VIYFQKGLDGEAEVFIDPNQLSPDGTIRIGLAGFSPDFRYVAISRSEAGSDWSELRVMEIATKQELPDRIRWVKFSAAAWYKDGFFYSGYDQPAPGEELKARNEYQKVFYHKLGETQEKDQLIYEDKEHPLRYVNMGVTEDQKYGILVISAGTSGNEIHWKDLSSKNSSFKLLIPGFDYDSEVIDNLGDKFLVRTNIDAPNYRLVLIDPEKPDKGNWQEILPEKPQVLTAAATAGGYLFGTYLQDAQTKVSSISQTASLSGKLNYRLSVLPLALAAGATINLFSILLIHSITRRLSTSTIWPRANRRFLASKRSNLIPKIMKLNRSFIPVGMGPEYRCLSSIVEGWF